MKNFNQLPNNILWQMTPVEALPLTVPVDTDPTTTTTAPPETSTTFFYYIPAGDVFCPVDGNLYAIGGAVKPPANCNDEPETTTTIADTGVPVGTQLCAKNGFFYVSGYFPSDCDVATTTTSTPETIPTVSAVVKPKQVILPETGTQEKIVNGELIASTTLILIGSALLAARRRRSV